MNCDEKLRHEGAEHVRNELRRQNWILRCGAAVRNSLQVKPAFSKVGVDFFGPLKVKHLRKQEKRYGCLFTCLVTRGVYLEAAHFLSTDSFIMCLRRFIARRGKPTVIYSDNGTNFVGANSEIQACLNRWNQDKITGTLSQEIIQWVFNPPAAHHMGGVWERLVISCRRVLTAVLQNHVLMDEVLLTEVESLVNNRLSTEVSSDADHLEDLNPKHFLIGRATPNLPPGIFTDNEISSQKRWRQAQVITTRIWKNCLREYLPGLTARKKWFQAVPNLKDGDLVLIVDCGTPRGC